MQQLQKVYSLIGQRNTFQSATFVRVSSSHLYWLSPTTRLNWRFLLLLRIFCLRMSKAKRLQTTQSVQSEEHQLEWDRARPLSEMPTMSAYSFFVKYLPGGKFYKINFADLLEYIRKEYGSIFYIPGMLGMRPVVITHNPNDFDKVFRTEGIWPQRRPFSIISHHREELWKDFFQGAEGLVHTVGEKWGSFRSAVNPVLMHPQTIKSYIPKMSKVNLEFIERIKEIRDPNTLEVPENFVEEISRYTLESVSVVALDRQIGVIRSNRDNAEVKQMFSDLSTFFRLLYELEFVPSLWKIIPTPKYRQMISALDGMNNFVIKFVDEAVERLEKSPSNRPEIEQGVLEKLLKIDKKIATITAMDLIISGVDTTTTIITGILLCLAKNPDKQQKLRDELLQVLPQKDTPFTEENMNKMPYLRACIKESIRIYPLGEGNFRTSGKDLVLSGYRVPKGTDISMVNAHAKNDPKYYVEPKKFLPERWLRRRNNNIDSDDAIVGSSCSNPFVYLPFGFGPRMCAGRRIVELEMEITAARIIRNFYLEFNYPTENAFKSFIINSPAIPLCFKFTDIQ